MFKFSRLQQGAIIGRMRAGMPFHTRDKSLCSPTTTPDTLPPETYLLRMAHAPNLGIKLPGESTGWFMAAIRVESSPDDTVTVGDVAAIVFYPDASYRSPETLLGAAKLLDDGGFLAP